MGKANLPTSNNNNNNNNNNSTNNNFDISEIEKEIRNAFQILGDLSRRMEERISELKEREKSWNELQTKVSEQVNKSEKKVFLNVGGQKFETTSTTLLSQRGTFFEAMLANKEEIDKSGEFFIDRDPKYFGLVLNFLRDGRMRIGNIRPEELEEVQFEFNYYKISCSFPIADKASSSTTTTTITTSSNLNNNNSGLSILSHNPSIFSLDQSTILSPTLKDTLKQWFSDRDFELVYKASRDGFQNTDFQQKCDGKGPTITILLSTDDFVFGAYSFLSFDALHYVYKIHPNSFLFTLSNPHSLPPTKYYVRPGEEKRLCGRWTDITKRMMVGWGEDLKLAGTPNVCSSLVCFPTSYIDTSGYAGLTFTGSATFKLLDIEVYSLLYLI